MTSRPRLGNLASTSHDGACLQAPGGPLPAAPSSSRRRGSGCRGFGGVVLDHPPWLAPYSIVGGLGPVPSDALRQVGHSVPLGVLAKPRAYFDLTHTWISLFLLLLVYC